MADHTKTITNTLSLLGGGRPTLWGNTGPTTMTWGTDKWGSESEDYIEDVVKVVANTLASTSAMTFYGDFAIVIANTLSLLSDMTALYQSSGIWFTVFPGDVTNSDTRISTDYTAASSQSSTYATPSTPSTTWS